MFWPKVESVVEAQVVPVLLVDPVALNEPADVLLVLEGDELVLVLP